MNRLWLTPNAMRWAIAVGRELFTMTEGMFLMAISETDCQIAAISGSRDAVLVTRNIRDFDGAGVDLVDPWSVDPN